MSFIIFTYACITSALSSVDSSIPFVTNYEISTLIATPFSNAQRVSFGSANGATARRTLRVKLISFRKAFDFVVTHKPILPPIVTSAALRAGALDSLSFYEKESDCDTCTRALGYIVDGAFTGIITSGNISYYVEPASTYFTDEAYREKVVVYRNIDVTYPPSSSSVTSHRNTTDNGSEYPASGYSSRESREIACNLEMTADHTLFAMLGSSFENTVGYLYLHAKYSDSIFRKSKLGANTVRITVKHIEVFNDSNAVDYPFKTSSSDSLTILEEYSCRIQRFCVSLCMLSRVFSGDAVGISYKADPLNEERGGVCETPAISMKYGCALQSFNTAIVTALSKKSQRYPLAITTRAVAHELGHSFGSDHDPSYDPVCSPGGDFGYFLMYPKTQGDQSVFSETFSSCSLAAMRQLIEHRNCLRAVVPKCGNGIKEGDEECDCGNKQSCETVDRCCTPSGGLVGEKQCTFRKKRGAMCSPKEDPCCTDDCKFTDSRSRRKCYSENCMESFCDGSSRTCPRPITSPDGTPCSGSSMTCSGGSCNSTVCRDNHLNDCLCSEFHSVCAVCCEDKNGDCVPAHKLGFQQPSGDRFIREPGTACYPKDYRCDMYGACTRSSVDFFDVGSDNRISIVIVCFVIFMMFMTFMCISLYFFRRRSFFGVFNRYRNGHMQQIPANQIYLQQPPPYIIGYDPPPYSVINPSQIPSTQYPYPRY